MDQRPKRSHSVMVKNESNEKKEKIDKKIRDVILARNNPDHHDIRIFKINGNLDVKGILNKHYHDTESNQLLLDDELLQELERYEDPFDRAWGTRDPSSFIFCSYL